MNTVLDITWPENLKKTRSRLLVWEALRQCEQPVSAAGLCGRISAEGEDIWLSTVYRVLDCFDRQGLLQITRVRESGMALFALCPEEHLHYAVCVRCNKTIPLKSCPIQIQPQVSESGFEVLGHRLQLYGYCSNCRRIGGSG